MDWTHFDQVIERGSDFSVNSENLPASRLGCCLSFGNGNSVSLISGLTNLSLNPISAVPPGALRISQFYLHRGGKKYGTGTIFTCLPSADRTSLTSNRFGKDAQCTYKRRGHVCQQHELSTCEMMSRELNVMSTSC